MMAGKEDESMPERYGDGDGDNLETFDLSTEPAPTHSQHDVPRPRVLQSRRRWIAIVASGLIVLACVVALGRTFDRSHKKAITRTLSPTSTPTAPSSGRGNAPVDGHVHGRQLNAHLGLGVPAGWVPVDEGEERVWVPNDWIIEYQPICTGKSSGVVDMGQDGQSECPHPKPWVALIPFSQAHTGRPSLIVHGYRIYDADRPNVPWPIYDIPQLDVSIATYGTLGSRILGTLAPSARQVALDAAYETVPSNSHAVTEDGVALSLPPSWTISTPTNLGCYASLLWDHTDELGLIQPDIGPGPTCPRTTPTSADEARDGVVLYLTSRNAYAPIPSGVPITTLLHGTTTITVYAEQYDPNALDLFVRKTGSSISHVLTLGLGRDGRIASGVLASLRATT